MRSLALAQVAACLLAAPALAQHAQVTSVAIDPNDPTEVWVANRGNDSVSVIDTTTGTTVAEIDVGVWPRSLAFSADGTKVFVANQRGNVAVDVHFVTPFTGAEIRGTVSVIDAATRTVTSTLTDVGTEPYGVAVSPNGKYLAVTGFRSGTLKLYDATTHAPLATLQYERTLNFLDPGETIADVDADGDMIPDLSEPRAFVIRSDSQRIYVTHLIPGYVSVVDVTLDGGGVPTAVALADKIDLNTYPFHPILNPTPVQDVKSQGVPRFLDDIALSPDGTRALVPHVLHNLNHDVNHTFVPAIDGDFANRVYPALTVVDTASDSYDPGTDTSARLHHELTDEPVPAEFVPYGGKGLETGAATYALGGTGSPVLGGTADFRVTGLQPGDVAFVGFGLPLGAPIPLPQGNLWNLANFGLFATALDGSLSIPVPNNPAYDGLSFHFQAGVADLFGFKALTNPLEVVIADQGFGLGKLGHRAGQPSRVLYNAAGDRAVLLNRGSEDVFLFEVNGSDLELMTVFPPRHGHVERAALDTTTPMGDLPLGMALYEDPTTSNDDGVLYIVNETTHTVSTLWIDFDNGVIAQHAPQIEALLGPDQMSASARIGQELFEDASRAQTAGNFNNSCASCHFEGGADGNVWQRPAGPRSTMPVYGGSLLTGTILWKGVRINMGETGPMFGGENGGHGLLTDAEQQGLIDYHVEIPVPLNPNLDPVTGQYSANAAVGKDLFFGTDETGTNPDLRHAGCATCHPDADGDTGDARGYTSDFLLPLLTDSHDGIDTFDPLCISLQENILGESIRNVNSGVNVDIDGDGTPENDRNADGYSDLETYAVMNVDTDDDFQRDDPNGYLCPDPGDPSGFKTFKRDKSLFSVPTKLGIFSTGPYFHDHSLASLRAVVDPLVQVDSSSQYYDARYPGVFKFYNEFHDVRGHEDLVPGASKVQVSLQTTSLGGGDFDGDVEAILEYITSL